MFYFVLFLCICTMYYLLFVLCTISSIRPISDFSCAEPNVNKSKQIKEFSSFTLDSAHEKFNV